MQRITTSAASDKTVKALARIADANKRTPAAEALLAVEEHIQRNDARESLERVKQSRKG